jgi:hypothetical protein
MECFRRGMRLCAAWSVNLQVGGKAVLAALFTSGFSENANNPVAQIPGSHYLQKPYGPTSLASTAREILESR